MKSVFGFAMTLWGAALAGMLAQAPAALPPATDTTAPNIPGVVKGGTKVLVVKDGFQGTEGPIVMSDGSLVFTEQQASRITKIDKDGNVSTYLEKANVSSGLAYDPKGRLISVQRGRDGEGKAQVGVLAPTNAMLVDNFEGQPFKMPNDLVADKKGGVYFTDSGLPLQGQPTAPREGRALYYLKPDNQLIRLDNQIDFPNGVVLSPDEKVVYANSLEGEWIFAYDVQPDGSVRNKRNFARLEAAHRPEGNTDPGFRTYGADGLAVDGAGRLYVATQIGVQVFSPQGQHLGTIPTSRPAQNVVFAGTDRKTLYVVGRGAVYKIAMQAQGYMGRAK